MSETKKVTIIGAGIGGIATAVFLAKQGYSVEIFEKNDSPGGRCSRLIRNGYRFDLGATMLMMPEIYKDVFNSLGIPLFEKGDIRKPDDLYRIYFDNNEIFEFSSDRVKMETQLENIEPGSSLKAEKYVTKGYEIFKEGTEKLIGRNFFNFFQFATPANLVLLVKLKTYISHWNYTKKFFSDTHLRMAFTFQNIYVGQSPFNSPALFSMVPAAELREGSFFPEGGMYNIVEKLLAAAKELGVKISYNKAVKKININNKRAESVTLNDDSIIASDIVIANADLPYVYRKLLPDIRRSRKIDSLKYSCSAICFHWGLDKSYPQLAQHNVFLSDGFREGLDKIFVNKSVSDNPSFYVHAPCRTDPSAAPAGHEALSFIVASGHTDPTMNQDWEQLKSKTRSALVKRLRQAGLSDIEEHIKFEACYTPETWENSCNITRGSVFGSIGHNILQMGWFRPHNRHPKYKNLFFVGGSTHPGNGIPNVLLSAKLTSQRILKK